MYDSRVKTWTYNTLVSLDVPLAKINYDVAVAISGIIGENCALKIALNENCICHECIHPIQLHPFGFACNSTITFIRSISPPPPTPIPPTCSHMRWRWQRRRRMTRMRTNTNSANIFPANLILDFSHNSATMNYNNNGRRERQRRRRQLKWILCQLLYSKAFSFKIHSSRRTLCVCVSHFNSAQSTDAYLHFSCNKKIGASSSCLLSAISPLPLLPNDE